MTFDIGKPSVGTGATLADLGLDGLSEVDRLVEVHGSGEFLGGLISICGARERVRGLGGWEEWLPDGARLFASGCFGLLMTTTSGSDLWLVDTQYGEVIESDVPMSALPQLLGKPEVQEDLLRASLFSSWRSLGGELPSGSVLAPTPAIALGGQWSIEALSIVPMSVYLEFTASLFRDPDLAPEIRRLGSPPP